MVIWEISVNLFRVINIILNLPSNLGTAVALSEKQDKCIG